MLQIINYDVTPWHRKVTITPGVILIVIVILNYKTKAKHKAEFDGGWEMCSDRWVDVGGRKAGFTGLPSTHQKSVIFHFKIGSP